MRVKLAALTRTRVRRVRISGTIPTKQRHRVRGHFCSL